MAALTSSRVPILAFGLALAAIYGVALTVLSRLGGFEDADLIAAAVTLDLTLLVPALYYVLLVRWRGWPVITVLPVFVAGVLLAERLIPANRQHTLELISWIAVGAEIVLIAFVAHRALAVGRRYRERPREADVYDGLREAAVPVLGPVAGTVLAYEIAVLYYAAAGWRRRAEPDGFTFHRENAYLPFAMAMLIAVVVETVAIHLLVQLWSPVAAWTLTAISLYALFWVIGDTQALRCRRTGIAGDTLRLRIGLRWTTDVPLNTISRVLVPAGGGLPRRTAGYLNAALLGEPNRRLELREPVELLGPYGIRRRATTLDLRIDEPERFDVTLAGENA